MQTARLCAGSADVDSGLAAPATVTDPRRCRGGVAPGRAISREQTPAHTDSRAVCCTGVRPPRRRRLAL